MARQAGKVLAVFDALPGEKVMGRYLFGRKQRGKVETLEVLQPATSRVTPRCPSFGQCGACSLQHMSVAAQQNHKQTLLLESLEDLGQLTPKTVFTPLAGPAWNYRRKARLSVRVVHAKERVLVGFRERNGSYVTDMAECHVLRREIADSLTSIAQLIAQLERPESIPQIEVACGDTRCALIIRHLEDLSNADIGSLRAFAQQTGIALYLQAKGPQSVRLLEPAKLQLEYRVEALGLHFRFEPLDFVQVNAELNEAMIMRVMELLAPTAQDHILDLFCGLGNFTLSLATRARQVTGVEGAGEMVERAIDNARRNGLDNADFHTVDLYESADKLPWPAERYTKIMLDPPRSGALQLLPWIAASDASQVLYISCNPETLARDAGLLVNQYGFNLSGAGIMDMFPHTPHSEAMALFERDNGR